MYILNLLYRDRLHGRFLSVNESTGLRTADCNILEGVLSRFYHSAMQQLFQYMRDIFLSSLLISSSEPNRYIFLLALVLLILVLIISFFLQH